MEKTTITLHLQNLSIQTNRLKKSFQEKKESTWQTLLVQIDTKNFRYEKDFSKKLEIVKKIIRWESFYRKTFIEITHILHKLV